ncbi:MAG: RHS repeat protein, partial [bacterium]|nr:RHS repeat protein [bacterium]
MSIPGRGFGFLLARSYHSQSLYSGVLGWGWDHNYNKRLLEMYGGDIIYYNGSGRRERFKVVKKDTKIVGYESPSGWFTELKKTEDGNFRHIYPNRTIEFFDTNGRLVKIQDRNQNKMEFYYNLSGQLTTVMDTMGRLYDFEYYEFELEDNDEGEVDACVKVTSGRLKTVTDPTGRQVEFTYDTTTGDLIKSDFEGRAFQYTYDSLKTNIKLEHNLVTVTDPKNQNSITLTYDDENKVTAQNIGGAAVGFVFNASAATVTDSNNNVKTYSHDIDGHALSITENSYSTTFSYTPKDGQVSKVTYPEGNFTSYKYDSLNIDRLKQGNLKKTSQAPGSRGAVEASKDTVFTYQNRFNIPDTITTPNGMTVNHEVNKESGNIEKSDVGFAGSSYFPATTYSSSYSYKDYGLLKKEITPSGTTNYDYYMASTYGGSDAEGEGYLKKINSPSGTQNFKQYNGTGNLVNYSNSQGISAQYTTNSFNEVTKEDISAAGSLSPMNYRGDYAYDDNGNLEFKATASGSPESSLNNNYSYTYDAR